MPFYKIISLRALSLDIKGGLSTNAQGAREKGSFNIFMVNMLAKAAKGTNSFPLPKQKYPNFFPVY